MRHLSNTAAPTSETARMSFACSYEAYRDKSRADVEWQSHLDWIAKNIVGKPLATKNHTAAELENMGYVGVYALEGLPRFWWFDVTYTEPRMPYAEALELGRNRAKLLQKALYVQIAETDTQDAVEAKAKAVCAALYGEGCFRISYTFGSVAENTRYYPTAEHCRAGSVWTDAHGLDTPDGFVGVSWAEVYGGRDILQEISEMHQMD